ncbi:MAG: hypothetical protein NWS64_01485 [Microbacteriaceae bacterium]|nr:hypothetical protein [Microbacteriaceae bacterium]
MSNTQNPEPEPRDGATGDDDGVHEEKSVDFTPDQPVSFEVPANTNLVINVVNEKPRGCMSTLDSGFSCLGTVIIILIVIAVIMSSVP